MAKSDLTPEELKIRDKFGERVHYLRFVRKMTQEQVGEAIQRTPNTISLIENGRISPSFEVLIRLAKVFDVEVGDLFHFDRSVPGES